MRMASLLGKYSYSEPMLTPARSAMALVLRASGPPRSKIRAAASKITSTVTCERAWTGAFLGDTRAFLVGDMDVRGPPENPSRSAEAAALRISHAYPSRHVGPRHHPRCASGSPRDVRLH